MVAFPRAQPDCDYCVDSYFSGTQGTLRLLRLKSLAHGGKTKYTLYSHPTYRQWTIDCESTAIRAVVWTWQVVALGRILSEL